MNHFFELYRISQKKGDPPFPTTVSIGLIRPPQNGEGKLLITPQLTVTEIDTYIDTFIKELELLRKTAKKSLQN